MGVSGFPHELDDAAHLVGDAYLLRALGQARLAIDTLVGSGIGWQGCAIAGEETLLALGIVGCCGNGQGQDVLVDGFVIETEVAWDVHAVGARHAVGAGGTRDGGIARSMNHRLWEAQTWLLSGAQ